MEGGRYHRDLWGRWWFEQPGGVWFCHNGYAWQAAAAPHPWYLVAPTAPTPVRSGSPRLWALLAGLAVVLVVVAIVVAAVGSSTGTAATGSIGAPADPAVVNEITHVPASVFDQVGIEDPNVYAPTVTQGHGPLDVQGKPGIFFFGAEFCPYCASERWSIVVALSRFGTWHGLRNMASSATDVYPSTQTLTFRTATFTSRYVGLEIDEAYDRSGHIRQLPTASENALLAEFNVQGTPFVDMGNKVLITDPSFTPADLSGLSRSQIAGGLTDPQRQSTRDIVATANFIDAGVCATDGEQPSSVCNSPPVTAAAAQLGVAT